MKKIKIGVMWVIFILILIISNNVLAANEESKLLYQDITINEDGSITIKEAVWLQGEYNGRTAEIEFNNPNAVQFTGINSDFMGDSDIYNGSGIKDIKIYDISQENFNKIEDISQNENTYKKVTQASIGEYGVFTKNKYRNGVELKIFCPDNKRKVICMEYTITDAVVVHNDVAELYWNVLPKNNEDDIQDFKVIIHLPGEDSDVRIWTHGPLTGVNKIIDSKTLEFQDSNVNAYNAETIRLMFNKDLVPTAIKKSNLNEKENILKYEALMADIANAQRELQKLENEKLASRAVINFEKNLNSLYYYENALEYVNRLDDSNEYKQEYLDRLEEALEKVAENQVFEVESYPYIGYYQNALECVNKLNDGNIVKEKLLKRLQNCIPEINERWEKLLEYELEKMNENILNLTQSRIDLFNEEINKGIDEQSKTEYLAIVEQLKERLQEKNETIRDICFNIILVSYVILMVLIAIKKEKIEKERKLFKEKYHRDFPSEDNPYVIEYLMNKKITPLSFSATILSLITKKVIKVEKNPKDDKDTKLVLLEKRDSLTKAEEVVIDTAFNVVGKSKSCSIKELKEYSKQTSRAIKFKSQIDKFYKYAKQEAEKIGYFDKKSTETSWIICIIIQYIIMFLIAIIGVSFKTSFGIKNLIILLIISILSFISVKIVKQDKNRTEDGRLEYSKWLAHKRYLEDFSNFDEKDLPEIVLWEKYLVTATILGCADKVEEKLKLYIQDISMCDSDLLIGMSIDNSLIKTLNSSVKTSISTARSKSHYSSSSSSSSYSSGGGFGGGSSGGGGRRWTEEAAEVVSRNFSE